jgi:hypothetical protein
VLQLSPFTVKSAVVSPEIDSEKSRSNLKILDVLGLGGEVSETEGAV